MGWLKQLFYICNTGRWHGIQENTKSHLLILVNEFQPYFPEYSFYRNPFGTAIEVAENIQLKLIEFTDDRHCMDSLELVSVEEL